MARARTFWVPTVCWVIPIAYMKLATLSGLCVEQNISADLKECLLRTTGHFLDHLRGVPAVMFFHELVHGLRVLECLVSFGYLLGVHLVGPGLPVAVVALTGVIPGEEPIVECKSGFTRYEALVYSRTYSFWIRFFSRA